MHRAALSYTSTSSPTDLSDEEIVRTWAHLVDRVARRISARTANTVAPGDLWSVGALGLIDAYRRFDPVRAVKFESFAEHRIRGAMMDELRELDHLPRRLRTETDRVRKMRHALEARFGREPSMDELAEQLGLPSEEVAALDSLAQPTMSLNVELPVASGDLPVDEQVDYADRVAHVTRAIERLPERLKLVLSLHYVEGLTYREIAQALEVSEARVCQLHQEAVRKTQVVLTELGIVAA